MCRDSQKLIRPPILMGWQLSGMMVRTMETVLAILVVQARNTVILVRSRQSMLLGNPAIRQQLAVYQRKQPRPSLRNRDRLFWSLLSCVWNDQPPSTSAPSGKRR